MYDRLDVQFDHTLGESFYEDRLAAVVNELLAKRIAQQSEGAVCIFFTDQDAPMLVRKQDGAFLYATTDLATIRYRMETWCPDAVLYVVDHRQSLHFQQLFAAAKRWGYDKIEFQHISFGTVLGENGDPLKPDPAILSAWKACWMRPFAARLRSYRPTTTPNPTARKFRPKNALK